jgi:hypothetical protein
VPRGGRLLDPALLFRTVRAVGDPFWLRGVEGTIEGVLVDVEGRPALKIPGSGEVLPLAALEHKVQWDVPHNRVQLITESERLAYERLVTERAQRGARVCIVGPLVPGEGGRPPLLEVRSFSWRPEPRARQASAPGPPPQVRGPRAKPGGRARPH